MGGRSSPQLVLLIVLCFWYAFLLSSVPNELCLLGVESGVAWERGRERQGGAFCRVGFWFVAF